MFSWRVLLLLLSAPLLIVAACLAAPRPCFPPEEAAAHDGKEICLAAHLYDITEDKDGTRYLEVCKPGVPDEACRLTIISASADRKDVGTLDALQERDIHIRGTVHTVRGQSFMLLSHARQLHDGPEKFRPNPELLSGFSAASSGTAFRDPSLSSHKRHGTSIFAGSADAPR